MTFKSKPSGCPKATYSVEDLFSPKTFKDKVYQKGDYPLEGLSQKLTHTMSKMTPEERSKCRKVAVSLLSQQTLSTLFDAEASLIALTPDKLPLNISLLSLIGSLASLLASHFSKNPDNTFPFSILFAVGILILVWGIFHREYKTSKERFLKSYLNEAIKIKESHIDLLQQ